jgi:hypothetical protein
MTYLSVWKLLTDTDTSFLTFTTWQYHFWLMTRVLAAYLTHAVLVESVLTVGTRQQ